MYIGIYEFMNTCTWWTS